MASIASASVPCLARTPRSHGRSQSRRHHQRRRVVLLRQVRIGAVLEQQAHHREIAESRGPHERASSRSPRTVDRQRRGASAAAAASSGWRSGSRPSRAAASRCPSCRSARDWLRRRAAPASRPSVCMSTAAYSARHADRRRDVRIRAMLDRAARRQVVVAVDDRQHQRPWCRRDRPRFRVGTAGEQRPRRRPARPGAPRTSAASNPPCGNVMRDRGSRRPAWTFAGTRLRGARAFEVRAPASSSSGTAAAMVLGRRPHQRRLAQPRSCRVDVGAVREQRPAAPRRCRCAPRVISTVSPSRQRGVRVGAGLRAAPRSSRALPLVAASVERRDAVAVGRVDAGARRAAAAATVSTSSAAHRPVQRRRAVRLRRALTSGCLRAAPARPPGRPP